MTEEERTDLCGHCDNVTRKQLLAALPFEDKLYDPDGQESEPWAGLQFVARCDICRQVTVYVLFEEEWEHEASEFLEARIAWPRDRALPNSVPPAVKEAYEEALRVQHRSVHSFAVQLRKGVEVMVVNHGGRGGTLAAKINSLRGTHPERILAACNAIRRAGNEGAHGGLKPVARLALEDVFRFLVDYWYGIPKQLQDLFPDGDQAPQ